MYFGNRKLMRWVKAPAPGAGFTTAGYTGRMEYLNGGVGLRESTNAHQEYTLAWDSASREDIRLITDYAYGMYGDDLIVWLDPLSMSSNVLSKSWSMPAIGAKDGVPLAGTERPELVLNENLSLGYPSEMARYTVNSSDALRKTHIPIPEGYTAWVGAHGVGANAGLLVQPTSSGVDAGSPTLVPVVSTSSTQRFSNSFRGGSGVGIDISLPPGVTVTLAGLMVQVLPNSVTPERGGFISGEGHSGCRFDGKPSRTPYFFADGRESIGLTAKLTEVGEWL